MEDSSHRNNQHEEVQIPIGGSLFVAGICIIAAVMIWSLFTQEAPVDDSLNKGNVATTTPIVNQHPLFYEVRDLMVGSTTISVEIADTDKKRTQGLSGREGLSPESGMLFLFPSPGIYPFWMHEMQFALDIIWINTEGVIVSAYESVAPDTFPEFFTPNAEALMVLEVPGGFMERYGIQIGDLVTF